MTTPPPGWTQPPQPPSWNHPVDQPDPITGVQEPATPRRAGRATLALGALGVLAVGLLAGVLLRGGSGASAGAATGPGGQVPSGYGAGQNGSRPDRDGAAGFPGAAGNATSGTISTVTPDGFTMTTSAGRTVTVTIGPDTTVSITATGATTASLAAGQTVVVIGTQSNGGIAATAVREGDAGRFGGLGGRDPGHDDDGQPGGA